MRFGVYILLLAILVGSLYSQGVTYINGCTTIDLPGEYKLPYDLTTESSTYNTYRCIEIESSDVIFDCDNYKFTNDGGFKGYAIRIYNSSGTITNVTIKNCNFDGVGGIYAGETTLAGAVASQIKVINNRFTNSNQVANVEGIKLESVFNSMIENNEFENSDIYLMDCDTSYIEYNTIENNNIDTSIVISNSDGISISHNTIEQNSGSRSINIASTKNSEIVSNNINYRNLAEGIRIASSERITVSDNRINDEIASSKGIFIDSLDAVSKDITLENNIINGTHNSLEIAGDNLIIRNNIFDSSDTTIRWGNYDLYNGDEYAVYNSQIYNNMFISRNSVWFEFTNPGIKNNPGTGNSFYISKDCTSQNIIGGSCKGGNYYMDDSDTYLRSLIDSDNDGIADQPPSSKGYVAVEWPELGEDKLPLTNKKASCKTIDTPGRYIIDEDLKGEHPTDGSTCLLINSSDVEVVCDGTSIIYEPEQSSMVSSISSAVLISGNNGYVENVTIRNCNIKNNAGDYRKGIVINSGKDIRIENSNIDTFSSHGIEITSSNSNYPSQNIVIEYVTFENAQANQYSKGNCIYIDESSDVLVSYASCNNAYTGLEAESPEEITIENSQFSNMKERGFYISEGEMVTISDNYITSETNGNGEGITLDYSVGDIIVENNFIKGFNYGLIIDGEGVEVYSNNISSNIPILLGISSTTQYNTFIDNYFDATSIPVKIDSRYTKENTWNSNIDCTSSNIIGGPCKGGNYYSNYSGTDNNNDGFGDIPYEINSENIDNLPLVLMQNNIQNNNTTNQSSSVTNQSNSSSTSNLLIDYKFNCPEFLEVTIYENGTVAKDIYVEIRDLYYQSLITSGLTDSKGKIEFNIIPPMDLIINAQDQINNINSSKTISLAQCSTQNNTSQNNSNQSMQNSTSQNNTSNNQSSNSNSNQGSSSSSSGNNSSKAAGLGNQSSGSNSNNSNTGDNSHQKDSFTQTSGDDGSTIIRVYNKDGNPAKRKIIEVIYEDGSKETRITDERGYIVGNLKKKVSDIKVLYDIESKKKPNKDTGIPMGALILAIIIMIIVGAGIYYYLKRRGIIK